MSSVPKPTMTPQEYLQLERAATRDRHFFWQGEMYAMSGASRAYVKISVNLLYHIRHAFVDRNCEVMNSDMRVKNERTDGLLLLS